MQKVNKKSKTKNKKVGEKKGKSTSPYPSKSGHSLKPASLVSLVDLLEAGCHFGHQVRRWNPKMKPYIWKESGGVHVFDLAITAQKLKEAAAKITAIVKEGQTVVFVGTKRQAKDSVMAEAKRCQMPYVVSRWPGGLLTNWTQISKSIQSLNDMKKGKTEGRYEKYTKKENVLIDRKITRLERLFGGLTSLTGRPDTIFVVDTVREKTAIREAIAKNTLVLAMVDSNSDPDLIDYPIPANDDALRSIQLIVAKIADAAIEGLQQRKDIKKDI